MAILAGGRARRFGGRDKSTILIRGRAILDRQIAEAMLVTDDVMLVGAVPGPDRTTAVRPVQDRVPGSGPLAGLDAALAAARDEHVAVIACDMPFVSAALLAFMLDRAGAWDAVVPRTERGYHPLCAVYARACGAAVARHLAEGRLRMLDLLDELRVRAVSVAELGAFGNPDRLLANVNTPAEHDALETLLGHEP